ncbi:MAG: hypothetical protein KC546_13955 [Anaerolineae bacterium]|nr:hypothetical protein [Anaerolineae bacterium]MCA9892899.1 hypothetical protein [Anaerolineae bacterium]
MEKKSPLSAVIAYIPIIGWLYVYLFARRDELALFHLRQSIGLVMFLIGSFLAWAVAAWILAWMPYVSALGAALFAFVIFAIFFVAVAWVLGIINALTSKPRPIPIVGKWSARLPIR